MTIPPSNRLVSRAPQHPLWETPPLVREELSDDGVALTLSGGGFRATLFHVGALWRLNELGILKTLARISSVSGGSIASGRLARAWKALDFRDGVATEFDAQVVQPLRRLTSRTVDWQAVLTGWFTLRPIANALADIYDRELLDGMRLRDLPDDTKGEGPRFVFDATNMQTGVLFRFSRDHAGDYRIGRIDEPDLRLSHAVAASSAFPPMLSPLVLNVPPGTIIQGTGRDLEVHPYTSRIVLADGGIYDNLGLEAVWRRYRRILVSDASALLPAEPRPRRAWLDMAMRAVDTQGAQVRDLRVRQLMSAYQIPESDGDLWRRGAYWGIAGDIAVFDCAGALSCPHETTMQLANLATRLKGYDATTQERLINWGYAICDASIRRWFVPDSRPPSGFPYPRTGV